MKYLIVIVIVFAVIWFIRNNRRSDLPRPDAAPQKPTLAKPEDMVRCPVCSLHLPRVDALAGPDGQLYCCPEHRTRGQA